MDNSTHKKKIAVLSSHTPSLFWFRMDMMKEFLRRGYVVYALANESEEKWKDKFEKEGIEYCRIEVCRNGLNPFKDRRTLKSIYKKINELNPDKIFTFQAKTVIYGAIAANKCGINEVYPLIAGMGSVFLSNTLKSSIVRKVMVFLYKKSIKNCPTVFFQNKDDEEIFRRYGIIKKQKVVLLHGSGVNTERFVVTDMPERISFLCISRLIRDKGVFEYLKACAAIKKEYPNVRCMLVGPYDTNPSAIKPEELKPYTDNVVEYFGEQNDVRPYISQCSVYILPSYREGTPKTNLEAMASGRAVITTDVPGCKETVVDGKNGFLIPAKDVGAIYEKMKWFVQNQDEIKHMGFEGRKMAEEVFDVRLVNQVICAAMKI